MGSFVFHVVFRFSCEGKLLYMLYMRTARYHGRIHCRCVVLRQWTSGGRGEGGSQACLNVQKIALRGVYLIRGVNLAN